MVQSIVSITALKCCTGKSLSEALLFAEHGENMLCTEIVLNVKTKTKKHDNTSSDHLLHKNCFFVSVLKFGAISVHRWEISGSLVLSSPHHERTLVVVAGHRTKESSLFFKFLGHTI